MTSKPNATKRARKLAVRYAKLGWRVLPIYPALPDGRCSCSAGAACTSPGKHPMTRKGVKDATTDQKQIKAWLREHPDANIGIATGPDSGILVFDLDPRNGGDETLRKLKKKLGALPKTVEVETGGGGRHFYFKCPRAPVRTSHGKRLGNGIDVMSNGAFVVAPPSRHISGDPYRWPKGKGLASRKPARLKGPWLKHLTTDQPLPVSKSAAAPSIPEGQRNNRLCALAGTLHRTGIPPEAILAAVQQQNRSSCKPPLADDEVESIVNSVSRYATSGSTVTGPDPAENVMQVVLDQHFANGAHLLYGIDGQFWAYGGTHWIVLARKFLENRILGSIQTMPGRPVQRTAGLIRQVISLMEAALAVQDDRLRFLSSPPPVINCRNGELWILPDGTVELRPHDPKSYLRHCLEVDYEPEAACPMYDEAVAAIFQQAEDPAAMARHWHELVGYIIQPERKVALVLILLGSGDNGKTTLIKTVGRLLGPDVVAAIRIDELEKNRFVIGSLLGKLLVVDDDVKAGIKLPDGELKKISEEKVLTGEHKFGQTFNFTCRTVPVLLCNNIISLSDVSYGMVRRLMVIPFDHRFTSKTKDPDLFPKVWASEMPGILNRAIEGLQRVIRRRYRFKEPEDVRRAKADWLRQANPVPAFIEDCCHTEPSATAYVQPLYEAYQAWCQKMGITLNQQQLSFRRNLEHLGFTIGRGNKGTKVRGLRLSAR